MRHASATSLRIAARAATAVCAVVSGCDRQPLDSRTGGGGGGGATGVGASGGGGSMGDTDRPICGSIEQRAIRLPADFLVLLDASGSMNDDASNTVCSGGCGASSKWALAAAAINGIVSETEPSTNRGLKLFADGAGSNSCAVTGGVAVPVGAGHSGAIAAAIAGRTSANGGVSRLHERQRDLAPGLRPGVRRLPGRDEGVDDRFLLRQHEMTGRQVWCLEPFAWQSGQTPYSSWRCRDSVKPWWLAMRSWIRSTSALTNSTIRPHRSQIR